MKTATEANLIKWLLLVFVAVTYFLGGVALSATISREPSINSITQKVQ